MISALKAHGVLRTAGHFQVRILPWRISERVVDLGKLQPSFAKQMPTAMAFATPGCVSGTVLAGPSSHENQMPETAGNCISYRFSTCINPICASAMSCALGDERNYIDTAKTCCHHLSRILLCAARDGHWCDLARELSQLLYIFNLMCTSSRTKHYGRKYAGPSTNRCKYWWVLLSC